MRNNAKFGKPPARPGISSDALAMIACSAVLSCGLMWIVFGYRTPPTVEAVTAAALDQRQDAVEYALEPIGQPARSRPQPAIDKARSEGVREVWQPAPGSPLALLPYDDAWKYVATRENLVTWIESVDELQDIDVDAIAYDADLAGIWQDCKDQQALRSFVAGYFDREVVRWEARENSMSLWGELAPVAGFMAQNCMTPDVTQAIDAYSSSVIEQIHGEGFDAKQHENGSKWELLHVALREAGTPSWDAVVEILRRKETH